MYQFMAPYLCGPLSTVDSRFIDVLNDKLLVVIAALEPLSCHQVLAELLGPTAG